MSSKQDFVVCPFDPNHKLKQLHLAHHIARCIRTYKGNKLRCPFNALEYIEPEDFGEHLMDCPSRIEVFEQSQLPSFGIRPEQEPPYFHDVNHLTNEAWGLEDEKKIVPKTT